MKMEQVEPVTGIGPAYPAWKAGVLPLNYTDGCALGMWARLPRAARLSGLSETEKRRFMQRGKYG